MKVIGIMSCLWLSIAQPAAVGTDDFKLVKQDKTVTLYERWIEQAGGEKVRQLKAVFDVRLKVVNDVARLLQNPQKGTNWNQRAKEYKISYTAQPGEWINYVKYGMPWPFDDQDCCILYRIESPALISFKSVYCDQYPPLKSITRMKMVQGEWLMENKGNGLTRMTYTISTSKSTNVPAWVSDPIVRNNMVETMKAFKKILENETAN